MLIWQLRGTHCVLGHMTAIIDSHLNNVVARLLMLATDVEARERVMGVVARTGTRLAAHAEDDYLFSMQSFIRDEYPEFQFFVFGRMIEVRSVAMISHEYSFCDFPPELLERRNAVEERFASLVLTAFGTGWFEPLLWEDLSPEAQSMCRPKFVADNCRYFYR